MWTQLSIWRLGFGFIMDPAQNHPLNIPNYVIPHVWAPTNMFCSPNGSFGAAPIFLPKRLWFAIFQTVFPYGRGNASPPSPCWNRLSAEERTHFSLPWHLHKRVLKGGENDHIPHAACIDITLVPYMCQSNWLSSHATLCLCSGSHFALITRNCWIDQVQNTWLHLP